MFIGTFHQPIRLLPGVRSKLIIEHEFALMKQLANVRLYSTRLYVHLPEDCDNKAELRQRISRKIKEDLPYFPFST